MTDRARVAEPFQEYTNFRGLGLSRSKIGVLAGACDSNPGSQVAAIQKAEADAATLAKEIAQLDEDISVYEGDKKAATEVVFLQMSCGNR